MKKAVILLLLFYSVCFSQTSPGSFWKIGYADMYDQYIFWIDDSLKQGAYHHSVDFYYPQLRTMGLTHVVTSPINSNDPPFSVDRPLRILDRGIARLSANNPTYRPYRYLHASGNAPDVLQYQAGGSAACVNSSNHSYGFGRSDQTSLWLSASLLPGHIGDHNYQDINNRIVFKATKNVDTAGLFLEGLLNNLHHPFSNDSIVLYINAKFDSLPPPNTPDSILAVISITEPGFTEQEPEFQLPDINRSNLVYERPEQPESPNFYTDTIFLSMASLSYKDYRIGPYLKKGGYSRNLNVKIYWAGNATMYIDYISACNLYYDSLFINNQTITTVENGIKSDLQSMSYTSNSNYEHIYYDEPYIMQARALKHLNELSSSIGSKTINSIFANYADIYLDFWNDQWQPPYYNFDNYQIHDTTDSASNSSLTSIQKALDLIVYTNEWSGGCGGGFDIYRGIRVLARKAKQNNIPIMHTMQVQSEYIRDDNGNWQVNLRKPHPNEITVQGWLALAYGVKGLCYYAVLTGTPDNSSKKYWIFGLYDEINNPFTSFNKNNPYTASGCVQDHANQQIPNDRYYAVKKLNGQISAIESEYMPLAWDTSYSLHKDCLHSGGYIREVKSYYESTQQNPPLQLDAANATYVEVGLFKKPTQPDNLDYFILVNRRVLVSEGRYIKTAINKSGSGFANWKITEVATDSVWYVGQIDSFIVFIPPGEGKLFRLEPVLLAGGQINYPEIIPANTTVTLGGSSYQLNASITVNGTLTGSGSANDTIIFTASGTNKLIFQNSTASNSTLNYVKIIGGGGIQILNNAKVNITGCTLENCTYGIDVSGASPLLQYNTITNSYYDGIKVSGTGITPKIYNNLITKTSSVSTYHNGQGIYAINGSSPFISANTITGFYNGMYIGGGTNAFFSLEENWITVCPNNYIDDNRYGIINGWGAVSFAGDGEYGSYNSILEQLNYDMYAYQYSSIYANNNYYGRDEEPVVDCDGTSYIDWSSPLEVLSCPEYAPVVSSGEVKITAHTAEKKERPAGYERIKEGLLLEKSGRIEEAVAHYKKMIKDEVYDEYAVTSLSRIKMKKNRSDIKDYFIVLESSNHKMKDKSRFALADFAMYEWDYVKAAEYLDKIIRDSSSIYNIVSAKFNKIFGAINVAKDTALAIEIIEELRTEEMPDGEMSYRLRVAESMVNGYIGNSLFGKAQNRKSETLPKEYALYQNYPNPFNPTTLINYQLPKDGMVTIKVFDILGKEVATLVNETKPAGRYSVNFDASNLPSGVFLYELIAGPSAGSGTVSLVKKMTVLK